MIKFLLNGRKQSYKNLFTYCVFLQYFTIKITVHENICQNLMHTQFQELKLFKLIKGLRQYSSIV